MFRLGIVIPSKNEYHSLKKIIKELKKKNIYFIIIDDCSNDQTFKYLKENNLNFLRNNKNIGYTKSIIRGLNYLKRKKFDYILTMDADGEHKTKDIEKFIKKIGEKKKFDILIANRSFKNRLSEKIISFLSLIFFNIKDPLSGFRLYKSKLLKDYLSNFDNNNYLVDFIFYLKKKDYKISNIEINNQKILNRKSRMGNDLLINLKIFFFLRFMF